MPRSRVSRRTKSIKGKEINFDTRIIGGSEEVFVDHDNLHDLQMFYEHLQTQSSDDSEIINDSTVMESEDINNLENGMCTSYEEGDSPPIIRRNLYRKSNSNIETIINVERLQKTAVEQNFRYTLPASFCPPPVAETILEPSKGLPVQTNQNIPDRRCEGSYKTSFSTLTHLTWFQTKSNDVDCKLNL